MAKEERKVSETKSAEPKAGGKSASGAKPSSGLSLQQKASLIGGAVLLAAILGLLLFPAGSGSADQTAFSRLLYNTSKNGILVDVRGAPSSDARQVIMQCGVNYISSPFYANSSDKELLAYFCDESGCLSSMYQFGLPNSTPTVSNKSVPFSDALYAMRDRPYIYVHSGAGSGDYIFHPNYMEVLISSKSNASSCSIRAVGG